MSRVELPWFEPGDELSPEEIDVARYDLEGLGDSDLALVLARYQKWMGTWIAWADTLTKHPEPLTQYGASEARAALRHELLTLRAALKRPCIRPTPEDSACPCCQMRWVVEGRVQ